MTTCTIPALRLRMLLILIVSMILTCGLLSGARAQTSITDIAASPTSFHADENQSTTITAQGTAGVANLAIRVTASDKSTVIRSQLTLTESPAGTYTATWNGRNDSNSVVGAGTYYFRVFNLATTSYIGPWGSVDVTSRKPAFISATVDPANYIPNGTDANSVNIHISARPISSGKYKWGIYNPWLGWMVYYQDLDAQATPGEYDISWNGVSQYSYAGYIGNAYFGYGETHSYTQCYVVLWAPDGSQLSSPSSAYFKVRGIWGFGVNKGEFEPRSGDYVVYTATGQDGLNLECKITRNSGGAEVGTFPMTAVGNGTYTFQWNGKNSSDVFQPTGDYTARAYNADSHRPYYPSAGVRIRYTLDSISVAPNPFSPNGTGTGPDQTLTVTVNGYPGQVGLKYGINNHWLGWVTYMAPLVESTDNPGTYTATWDGVSHYSNDGLMGSNYSGYGENHSYNASTVSVWDANNQEALVHADFKTRGIDRLERDKDSFAAGSDTVTFTARGYSGFHARIRIYRNSPSVLAKTADMTDNGDGTYTYVWDGTDDNGVVASPGDYTAYVYNSDSDRRYYPSVGIRLTFSVQSITVAPDPFSPNGTDANVAAITVQAAPGQVLKYGIHNNWLGWMVYRETLTETSTPGTYQVNWNGVARYSYNGSMGSNYNLYGETHSYNTSTVYVWDTNGQESIVHGYFKAHGVCELSVDKGNFNPRKGDVVNYRARGYSGFNVRIRIYRNNGNLLMKTADMTDNGDGTYSYTWDGKDENGDFGQTSYYTAYIYNKDCDKPYVPSVGCNITFDVGSITVDKDPFVPSGDSSDVVKITVNALPGQALQYYIGHESMGTQVNWTSLTETSPGVYEAAWDGVQHYNGWWNYNTIPGHASSRAYVYVRDANNSQAPTMKYFKVEGAHGISASPNPFTPGGDSLANITVPGYTGLNLDVTIYNNATNVLVRRVDLTESSTGSYKGTWDGKDSNGNFAGAGTYRFWPQAKGKPYYYNYSYDLTVKPSVFSIAASPDPFSPTGDNSVTLTLRADAGQSGLYATISHPNGANARVNMVETGSEGTYVGTWDGKFNGDVSPNGLCVVRVYGSNGTQFPTTRNLVVASVANFAATPNPFEPGEGRKVTVSVDVDPSVTLSLEARVDNNKALPLIADGNGHYTTEWDGQISESIFVAAGSHTIYLYNSASGQRYSLTAPLTVVDTTPPSAFVVSGPAEGSVVLPNLTFTWTGADNVTSLGSLLFSYKSDDADWSAFTSDTSKAFILADGDHTFSVRAKDQSGNITTVAASPLRHFTVDSRPLGSIEVKVNDSADPAVYISGATVKVTGGPSSVNLTGTTDSSGRRQFDSLRVGDYTVTVSMDGYLAASVPAAVTSAQVNPLKVSLTPILTLTKVASADEVIPGAVVTYQLTVKNNDPANDLTDVRVSDALPSGLTVNDGSAGPEIDHPSVPDAGYVTWTIDSLASGASETVVFSTTMPSSANDGAEFTNTAIAGASSGTYSSNAAVVTVRRPVLTLTKEVSNPSAASGQVVTYTINYSNPTAFEALQPVLSDAIPYRTTYIAGSTKLNGTAVPDPTAGPAIAQGINLDAVSASQTGKVEFQVKLDTGVVNGTDIANAAYVSGGNLKTGAWSNTVHIITTTPDVAPPDTSITSGPGENSSICGPSATLYFSGSDDTTPTNQLQYSWRLDGGDWSAFSTTTSAALSGLAAGSHTFEVMAKDLSDKVDPTPAARHFGVDLSSPVISVIASVPAPGSVVTTWTTDKLSTSQVDYGLDNTYGSQTPVYGSVTSHSVNITGLSPQTIYHYRVRSRDACGRETISDDMQFTTLADTTAPEAWLTSGPSEGATVCAHTARLCWSGRDDVTPTAQLLYSWKLDSSAWSTASAETCHDFTQLAEGAHTMSVRAVDGSGNATASPVVRKFSVDLSDPHISNASATPAPISATVSWWTDKPATSQVEYGVEATYGSVTPLNSALATGHNVTVTGLDAGTTYHYRAKSKDGCGREVVSGDLTFTTSPDAAPPDTQITSGPGEGAQVCEDLVTFGFTGSDDTTHVSKLRYAWRIDGGEWSAYATVTTANLSMLAAGTHTFEVAAKDLFDKVDPAPAVRHFTVNLDAPAISDVKSAPSRGDATVSWTTDEVATSQVEYGTEAAYGSLTPLNSGLVTSHSVSVTGLSASTTYHYRVRTKDACGRETLSADATFTTQADDGTPETTITTANPSEGGISCSTSPELCWTGKDDVTPASKLLFSWKMDSAEWSEYGSETCHRFTGLAEGSHAFYVKAKDASGNVDATPAIRHFNVDLTSPALSNISASCGATTATISWLTDKPATSLVEYGPTTPYASSTTLASALVNSHSVILTGLSPDSSYHFRVKSKDGCEREVVSGDQTFKTGPDTNTPDTRVASGPDEMGKSCETNVSFCWTGSDDATPISQLLFSYKMDSADWSDWSSDMCHQFTGLADGLHTLQVRAKDTAGNVDATPAIRNFKVDTSMPTISNVLPVPRQSSVTVSWITSEPTTSQLDYGASDSYGSKTSVDPNMVTSHKMTISGLTSETTYHVRVRSSDGCREAVGGDNTVKTDKILPPNLAPMGIMSPPSTASQQTVQVTYTVRNLEPGDAPMPWMDGFYLSTDEVLDSKDIALGQFPSNGALTGLFSYTQTQNLQMPIVAPGIYYILLKVDDGDIINETTKSDNVLAQAINVTLVKQMTSTPDQLWMQLNPGSPVSGQIDLSNLGTTDLTKLTAKVNGASPNIVVQVDAPPTLEALTSKKVNYTIIAADESVLQTSPTIDITTDEGALASTKLNLYVIPRQPKLVANPGYLESGMLRGKQTMVECEVTNTGGVPAKDVKVMLPSVPWLSLVSPRDLGSIAPGEKVKVTLALSPGSSVPLGPYNGNIALAGSNGGVSINFSFKRISDGIGDLRVLCKDEFSFFAEDHPGVSDATVTLRDALDGTVIFEAMPDNTGIYLKQGIKEGHYNLEVKAYKHATFNAPVEIVAGQVQEITAFMRRQLVTYTWNVEPFQLEDKYKITLEAVFEAHVPAPVVTVDPPYTLLPVLEGKTTEIDYTITNHGLIAALGVKMDFDSNDVYEIVPLIRDIGILPAESSVVVPVLIRARKDGPIELPQVAAAAQAAVAAKEMSAGTSVAKPEGVAHALETIGGEDPMKRCDLTINGKVIYYYKCVNDEWQMKSINSTPLYIAKTIYDVVSCGFDALACAGGLASGAGAPVAAAKCPDAIRCMFKYLCSVISAYGGTPCCYCKMVSSILGDTGEMSDAVKCLPMPSIPPSPPPTAPDWSGVGLNLPGGGFAVNMTPWDFGQGVPGPCQGKPKPPAPAAASLSVKSASEKSDTDISKYGGKEVRCNTRCW